ncbi:MAG: macrocin O-methyltransferase [Rhodocyclaceae bacterium]|nr:macrocin O-methyltransferase [Rhodocyclaceae bacterium]
MSSKHPQEVLEPEFLDATRLCHGQTMVGLERMYATWQAVRYVGMAKISGALVECGVWRGGNLMLMALALLQLGQGNREIWGYDTFEGMPMPTSHDVDIQGRLAAEQMQRETGEGWCAASESVVKENLRRIPYPQDQFRLVPGRVEETIPRQMPRKIALLRLDTDWYESTRHELIYLFPLLEHGGVIIVDDYGHWQGAKRAVDEYFSGDGPRILLNRIDYTGRIGVKL